MPLYYFILKAGCLDYPDSEGQEFPNDAAAQAHACTVAREIMRNREIKTGLWRVQVCDDYLDVFKSAPKRYGFTLPDPQLACAPVRSPEGQSYLGAMRAAANFAWCNRQLLTHQAREVFARSWNCGSRVPIVSSVSAVLEGDVPLCMDFIGHAQYLGEDLHVHCAEADLMVRDRRVWIARGNRVEPLENVEPESDPDRGFLDLLDGAARNVAPFECALPVFRTTMAILESSRTGRSVEVGNMSCA